MPSIRDVIQQRTKGDEQFESAITVIRCKLVGVDDVESASVSDREGYVWARRYNDTYGVFQVFNGNVVNPIVGVPVLVELSDGEHKYRIIGIDYLLAESTLYEEGTREDVHLKHAPTHEWPNNSPGTDAISIYVRALVPLKTYVYSSLVIGVAEGRFSYNGKNRFFGNTYMDTSNYIPAAGYTCMLLVSINPNNSTVKLTVSDSVLITDAPEYPNVPITHIPSSYVQLTGGMTIIREADIADIRVIMHAPNVNMQEIYALFNDIDREMTIHQYYGDVP